MKRSVFTMLGVGIITAVLVCGCQMNCKCCEKKRINTTMTEWKAALTTEDLEKVMSAYSESYASERISSKEEIHQFMVGIFDEGWIDNTRINLENAVTEIKGDKARFGPVEFNSDQGTMEIDYTLQKEGRAWLIVSSKWLQQ